MLTQLKKDMQSLANPKKAKILQGFFKTGTGQYGEGDVFLGIVVPQQRVLVKKYRELDLNSVQELLNSKIHEHRLVGALILVKKYEEIAKLQSKLKDEKEKIVSEQKKKIIFDFYIKNAKNINNWDLVDLTAPNIVGNYLLNKNESVKSILYRLVKSDNLWERRISILATFTFIRNNDFEHTLNISKILLNDKHDLIHKATGWMLREIGKRNQSVEESFLKKHYKTMPRTMLRYAIEKFEEKKRKSYLL